MNYHYSLNKLFCIWFHKNSVEPEKMNHQFMPYLNIKRLIQMRKRNPEVKLSLIYTSKTLTAIGKARLLEFCRNFRIDAVDYVEVASEIKEHLKSIKTAGTTLVSEIDLELATLDFYLTQNITKEITKCINNEGGNLAAASDMVRILGCVIERCGHYFDLDVRVYYHEQASITYNTPFIMYGNLIKGPNIGPSISNEFIAFAEDEFGKIHPDAKSRLEYVKRRIVNNYLQRQIKTLIANFPPNSIIGAEMFDVKFSECTDVFAVRKLASDCYPFEKFIIPYARKVIKLNDHDSTIISLIPFIILRRFFHNNEEKMNQFLKSPCFKDLTELEIINQMWGGILDDITKTSVVLISGPGTFDFVLSEHVKNGFSPVHSHSPFKKLIHGTDLKDSDRTDCHSFESKREVNGNDLSWSNLGNLSLKKRSEEAAQLDINKFIAPKYKNKYKV